jgi:CubicO group peptidase (beta-lactamase class C family)
MSLRDFAERNIFGPLGMKDTHIHDDNRMIIARRAEAYSPAPGGAGFVLEYSTNFDRVGPGGVNTTVRDMALWDHSFDTGTLGGPEFRRTMLTRGVLTSGDSMPYALGLQHGEEGGLRTISHGGSSLGFRAHYLRFPDQHVSIFVLATPINRAVATRRAGLSRNRDEGTGSRTSAQAAAAPAEAALPAAELQNFTGQYGARDRRALRGSRRAAGSL